jgi:hypothetical protein
VAGLATFASRAPVLQDVEWTNMGGFDDEGTTKLTLAEGLEPRFHVLQLPATIESIIPFETNPQLKQTPLPLAVRDGIPVVDLDPVLPLSHVVAAALFPADQATVELFQQAPQTVQMGPLLVKDFDLVRWARPEQIRLLSR